MIGRMAREHDTFSKNARGKKLSDGTPIRGDIPKPFESFLQGDSPKVEIPESSRLFQSGSILCMQADLSFSEGVRGIPAYLYLNGETVRISLSYPTDSFEKEFEGAYTLFEWQHVMSEAYASGVPNFDEIEERLNAASHQVKSAKLTYGITIWSHNGKAILVARGLCRDVYYEAAKIDGVMRYRTEYIGPKPSQTFDLTADQLWDELVRNTLWDIPHLFTVPRYL